MRNITIIALHHKLQWRDTDLGHLESLLTKVLEGDPSIELIAEEANKLPTTVGQRIAFRFIKPWANVDMDETERQRQGIYEELQSRGGAPLDDDSEGYKEYYLPKADGIREDFWFSKINGYHLERVVFLCGLLHLSTITGKFQNRGWIVEQINACALPWYVERFGTLTIVEENGYRWCECRPNNKMFISPGTLQKRESDAISKLKLSADSCLNTARWTPMGCLSCTKFWSA
ncbi:MAG: hypothetical protein WCA13_03390 [Terriglobales bacterium]